MKISNVGSTKATTSTERKKKASAVDSRDFADELMGTAETPEAPAPVETSSIGSVESILAIQEVPDSTEDRSRGLAHQYGDDLLDRLESLRRDLLTGSIPMDRLAGLAHRLREQRGRTDDPHLRAIIDEIELRARVEIAKYTRDV